MWFHIRCELYLSHDLFGTSLSVYEQSRCTQLKLAKFMFWPLKIYQGFMQCYPGEGEKSGGSNHSDSKRQAGNEDIIVI
jgi:hypothetical protein